MTAPTLRPFDRQDLADFPGVETAHPLINFQGGYVVLVDGNRLEFYTMDEEGDTDGFAQDYRCAATAEAVGNDILTMAFGGSTVGGIVGRFSLQSI